MARASESLGGTTHPFRIGFWLTWSLIISSVTSSWCHLRSAVLWSCRTFEWRQWPCQLVRRSRSHGSCLWCHDSWLQHQDHQQFTTLAEQAQTWVWFEFVQWWVFISNYFPSFLVWLFLKLVTTRLPSNHPIAQRLSLLFCIPTIIRQFKFHVLFPDCSFFLQFL